MFSQIFTVCLIVFVGFSPEVISQATNPGEVVVTTCWSYPIKADEPANRIASDGNQIYIGLRPAKIQALSFDGKEMWTSEFGGEISSNILPTAATLFVATTTSGAEKNALSLRSLSRETGITNWTVELAAAGENFLFSHRGMLLLVSNTGSIFLLNAKDGSTIWRHEIAKEFIGRPSVTEKTVAVSAANQIFIVSTDTGEISTMRKLPINAGSLLRSEPNHLFIGDERGGLSSYMDAGEKAAWKFRSGGSVSAILNVGGDILFTSHDNFAYLLSDTSGSLRWKRRLSGRVSRISVYEDKYVIISTIDDHLAILIDAANGKTAGKITFADDQAIVDDPVVIGTNLFVLTNKAANRYSLTSCGRGPHAGK